MSKISRIHGVEESCPWMGKLPAEMTLTGEATTIPPESAIIVEMGKKKRLMSLPKGGRIRGQVRMAMIENAEPGLVKLSDPLRPIKALVTLSTLGLMGYVALLGSLNNGDVAAAMFPMMMMLFVATRLSKVRKERYAVEVETATATNETPEMTEQAAAPA